MPSENVEGLTRDDILRAAAGFTFDRKTPKWTVIVEGRELPARPLVLAAAGVTPNDPTNSHMAIAKLKSLGFETRYAGQAQTPAVDPQRFDAEFFRSGLHYYAAARSAARAQFMPVCGNLYHHAIEMLLKGRLVNSYSSQELRQRPFGHNLATLWATFKSDLGKADLGEFDGTIAAVEQFENIRYPDELLNNGALIKLDWIPWKPPADWPADTTPRSEPRYGLVVTDIDRLVAKIFEVCSRSPVFFTGGLNQYAREAITYENPACKGWFFANPSGAPKST